MKNTNEDFTKGLTLIEVIIVTFVIAILAAIAIPMLLRSKMAANEVSAIKTMRTLNEAQVAYRKLNGGYGSLIDLVNNNFLSAVSKNGEHSGYILSVTLEDDEECYYAYNNPESCGKSGETTFFTEPPSYLVRGKMVNCVIPEDINEARQWPVIKD